VSCEPQALRALGLPSGDVAARLYSVAPGPANPPNVRSDQTSGGRGPTQRHDDSVKPGHGRLALAAGQASSGGERNGRSPGFKPLLAGRETGSSGPSVHQSSGVVDIRQLGGGA
jgi:hypothetical protein